MDHSVELYWGMHYVLHEVMLLGFSSELGALGNQGRKRKGHGNQLLQGLVGVKGCGLGAAGWRRLCSCMFRGLTDLHRSGPCIRGPYLACKCVPIAYPNGKAA